MHFGEHLTIDGYNGSYDKLEDRNLILNVLTDLPKKLGMKILGEPHIYRYEGNDIKDPGGWTGVVVIAESHISIHTFSKRRFVTFDVYTCKSPLDTQLVIDFMKDLFDLEDVEVNFIKRGTRYPDHNLVD